MIEKTKMVVSFMNEEDFTENAVKEITNLLKKFGKETQQESVAFVIDGEMFYINISYE